MSFQNIQDIMEIEDDLTIIVIRNGSFEQAKA
jgi:hypothetical protein